MLAFILFAAGGFLLRDRVTPDAARLAFDRVQPGMTIDKVDEVVARYFVAKPLAISIGGDDVHLDYRCPDATVSVHFFRGHVINKRLYRFPKPTFWDALQAWLNRARAAVRL
jgi:hypothetical protein